MTEPGKPWGEVVVERVADGALTVTYGGPAPDRAIFAPLPVLGGVLQVDLADPFGHPPRAVLTSPYWAQCWLAGVYGDQVADAVEQLEDPGDVGSTTVVAQTGFLSEVVGRLAVGTWLRRWWPSGSPRLPELDVWLLELELGALSWLTEACFVDTGRFADLLAPHTGVLVSQIEGLRAQGHGAADARALEVMLTALRATVAVVVPETPGYDACRVLLDVIDAEDAVVAAAHVPGSLSSLPVRAPEPVRTKRSATRSGMPVGKPIAPTLHSTVDWTQVPARLVLGRSENVRTRFLVGASGGTEIEVRVAAAPAVVDRPDTRLNVRAYGDESPQVFALDYDPGEHAFIGRRPLRPDLDIAGLAVDVFAIACAGPPRFDKALVLGFQGGIVDRLVGRLAAPDAPGRFLAEQAAAQRWERS